MKKLLFFACCLAVVVSFNASALAECSGSGECPMKKGKKEKKEHKEDKDGEKSEKK